MVNPTELMMGRRQIKALIDADPIMVSFRRRVKVASPSGGWTWGALTTLPPQRVTLIPFKRRMTEYLVNTELGDVADLPYVLIGPHTLDVQRDDQFTHLGEEFVVRTIDLKRDVRIAAHVDYSGGPNG